MAWALELIQHYAQVFGKGNRWYDILFSLGGFTKEMQSVAKEQNVQLVTLEEMYKA